MSKICVLTIKELKSIFYSPIAYVVGAIFSLLNGFSFWVIISLINNPVGEMSENVIELFFGGTLFFWMGLLIVIPIITMRALSEEKRSGTIELLFTAPITDVEIVLSKFISGLLFYLVLWIPTVLYIIFVDYFGQIDYCVVLSAYIGTFLLGAAMLSFGILFSALTKNQIISAVLTFAVLTFLFSIGFIGLLSQNSMISKIINYIWLIGHFEDFSKGLIDFKRIVCYFSYIIFNLYVAVQVLGARRWK